MKIYLLFISRKYLDQHPLKGQPTNFKEKILSGQKITTLRHNLKYWIPRLKNIQEEKGYLSLREWEGTPRHSDSLEFLRLYKIGYETLKKVKGTWLVGRSENTISDSKLAINDGLSIKNFNDWFPALNYDDMIIIHFTKFRYSSYENEEISLKSKLDLAPIQTSLQFDFPLIHTEPKPLYHKFDREY